jgi:hypothetical protein
MAPVKNQCSGNFFYGQDSRLEDVIQLTESKYGETINKLLISNNIFSSDDKDLLRFFWLFQHTRTEAAAIRAVELSESTGRVIGAEEFGLGIKEAVLIALSTIPEAISILKDLKFCLIRNKTRYPFITSDNPAILTNKWQVDNKRTRGHSFGMHSAGALLLLPLSPKLLCVGYDGDVYNIPHKNGTVDVKSERDIQSFNVHQFLNCQSNVFYQDKQHTSLIHEAYLSILHMRPKIRHSINYAVFDGAEGNTKRYKVIDPAEAMKYQEAIIHHQIIHPRPNIWPSQISTRRNGSVYSNGTGIGYVRQSRTSESEIKFFKEKP